MRAAHEAKPTSEATRIGSADEPTLHQTLTSTSTNDASLSPTPVRASIHRYLLDDEQEHRTRTSGRRVQAKTSAPIQGPQGPQGYGARPQIPRRYLQLLLPFVSYIVSGTWFLLSCFFIFVQTMPFRGLFWNLHGLNLVGDCVPIYAAVLCGKLTHQNCCLKLCQIQQEVCALSYLLFFGNATFFVITKIRAFRLYCG